MKSKGWTIPQILRSGTLWLLVFAMLTLNGAPVQAQPLVDESHALTPISSGSNSSFSTSSDFVIRDPVTYANFFAGTPPAAPVINFATEDVLAVTMGTAPPGSSINITGVTIDTTGLTAGFAHVYVSQTLGSGGTTGPISFTGGSETNTGGSTTNTGGTVVMTGTNITVGTAVVNGVPVTQVTNNGGTTTITGGTTTTVGGTTTAQTGTETLVNNGGTTTNTGGTTTATGVVVATGGTITTNPTGITITGATTTTSGISTTGGSTTITGGTTTGGSNTVTPYAAVAVPKGALFYDFVNAAPSLPPYTGPVPFSSLTYAIGNISTPYDETVTIDSTGHIMINKTRGGGASTTGGTNYSGQLSQIQLKRIADSVFKWAPPFANVPPTITDPSSPKAPILPGEALTVYANGVGTTVTVQAAGFYGNTQLKQVTDAIRGPVEQIIRQTVGTELRGTVTVNGNTVSVGSQVISPNDPMNPFLADFVGRTLGISALYTPTGVSVLGVDTRLIASDVLLTFPNAGAPVIASLPLGTHIRGTDLTLSGIYVEVTANEGEQRGFVQTSSIVPGPSATGQATIHDLLFQKYLLQGGLDWFSVLPGFVDPSTGLELPAPAKNEWQLGDPDHATNIITGQNAYYDHPNQQWFDTTSRQPLSASGYSPAAVEDGAFQIYLQQGGSVWNGVGPGPGTTGWLNPTTGQSVPAPTNDWERSDPDHAVSVITGENAVYDVVNLQWVDATTRLPLSPSVK